MDFGGKPRIMESQVRMNYSKELEAAVNKQINIELYASYVYLSMSVYFDRDDVALPHISPSESWTERLYYFKLQSDCSEEERGHASKFMKMQNLRGGRVVLQAINKPEKDEWGSALEAFQARISSKSKNRWAALALEKFNNQALLDLHTVATESNDPQFTDFLESEMLEEQTESISEMGKMVTNLKRVGSGLGEYMFDKEQHFE
ncbi:ferritin-like protein [Ostertagia ostertagi]